MAPVHIKNAPIASLAFGPGQGLVFYGGLDGSIMKLELNGRSFVTPVEQSISSPGVAKDSSPFAACLFGQSIRVYYVDKDNFLCERCQDGGDWYDGGLNNLRRKVDNDSSWLYAMNVGDASNPILRVGFTQDGQNGTIDECIWMAVKSTQSDWHIASYDQ